MDKRAKNSLMEDYYWVENQWLDAVTLMRNRSTSILKQLLSDCEKDEFDNDLQLDESIYWTNVDDLDLYDGTNKVSEYDAIKVNEDGEIMVWEVNSEDYHYLDSLDVAIIPEIMQEVAKTLHIGKSEI